MNVTTPNVDTIICGDRLEEMKKLPDISRNSRREQAKIFCVEEILPDALDEIDRMRAENADLSKAVIDISQERDLAQAEFRAYHKAWEQQTDRIKELEADLEQSEISIQARLDVIDQQAARIKVLEQAFLQNAYERNKVSHGHSWYPDDETYEDYLNRVDVDAHAEAQRSLDAILVNARPPGVDGKISIGDHIVGPDQMVPCWQITEERKKTLIDSIELIELNNYYNDHTMFDLCNMLRAMREVAE